MISYKEYRLLNESLDTYVLGVKPRASINTLRSQWEDVQPMDMGNPEMGQTQEMPEQPVKKFKKRIIKKDMGDNDFEDEEETEEDDDDDMDDDDDEFEDDEEEDEFSDDDDEDGDEDDMDGENSMKMKKKPKKDLGGMSGMPQQPMQANAMQQAPQMMHKEAKKHGKMKDVEHDDDCDCKKCEEKCDCGKCKKCKMANKKMTKEEFEFLKSIQDQAGTWHFDINKDGSFKELDEDFIVPPSDPNQGLEEPEAPPGPGEVGYAPQTRFGFNEWASKHKKRTKRIGL